MACFKPVGAYKISDRSMPSGFRTVFTVPPGMIGHPTKLACRQCLGCRLEHARQWATRIMHEAQDHQHRYFLTLTYDEEHLPEGGTLVMRHHQNFMKALRKHYKAGDIRFFGCGEYGEITHRPHYHYVLFGAALDDLKRHSKSGSGETLYQSETLNSIWGKGQVMIGRVTQQSCEYVARYSLKKVTGDMADKYYERVHPVTGERYWLLPEFVVMSRRGGIGRNFYERFRSDLYPSDFCVSKGKKLAVPRYYEKLLKAENPEMLEEIKKKRRTRAKAGAANNTPQRLAARRECTEARLKLKKRSV